MTIKELEKIYPYKKYEWYAWRNERKGTPNWNYKDTDNVISYEIAENVKSVDITKTVFNKGKIETTQKTRIYVIWGK